MGKWRERGSCDFFKIYFLNKRFHHQINSCEIIDEKSSCDNDDENSIKRQTNASNPVPIIINQPLQHQVKTSSSFISSGN